MHDISLVSPYGLYILFAIRVFVAIIMVYFGWQKITDLKGNADNFTTMGLRPGWLWGTVVAVVEFVGGIALLLGIYTWVVAILFGFEMLLGTIWKVTSTKKPFSDWSYDILLLAIMLVFLTFGAGAFTII